MSVEGCDEAYSLDKTTASRSSRSIDHLALCGESAFLLDYLAGQTGPLDEGQLDALLGSIDFTGYQLASSAATEMKRTFPRSSTERASTSPSSSTLRARRVQAGLPMRKSIDWAAERASSS